MPYERFARFHEVMAEESAQTVLSVLFSHILPLVPEMTERLEEGASLLDLGCGRGRALAAARRALPGEHVLRLRPLGGRDRVRGGPGGERGLGNVRFAQRDLSTFDVDAEPGGVRLRHDVRRGARPGQAARAAEGHPSHARSRAATYLMQDIQGSSHHHENLDHPGGPLLYMISCMHCMTVSLAQGGDGLGAMWGEQKARELLAEAGFTSVDVHLLEHDPFNAYFVVRP